MTHQSHLVLCLYIKYSKRVSCWYGMDYLYFTLANSFYNQQLLKNVHYKVIRGLNYMALTDYLSIFTVTKKAARKQTGASLTESSLIEFL